MNPTLGKTNRELRDLLNTMPEDQLDNEFIIQGEESVIRIESWEALPEDYINPGGEWDASEPRSIHLLGGDAYEENQEFDPATEPASIKKGTIIFYAEI